MKRLALAITTTTVAALLAGCIIIPPRHGGYRDGHGYGGYRSSGVVVVQPGPQR